VKIAGHTVRLGVLKMKMLELASDMKFVQNELENTSQVTKYSEREFTEPSAFVSEVLKPWNADEQVLPVPAESVFEFFFIDAVGLEQFLLKVCDYVKTTEPDMCSKLVVLIGRLVFERLLPVGLFGIDRNFWIDEALKIEVVTRDVVCAIMELAGDADFIVRRLKFDEDEISSSKFSCSNTSVLTKESRVHEVMEVEELEACISKVSDWIARNYADGAMVIGLMLSTKERKTRLKESFICSPKMLEGIRDSLRLFAENAKSSDAYLAREWFWNLTMINVVCGDSVYAAFLDPIADSIVRLTRIAVENHILKTSHASATSFYKEVAKIQDDYFESMFGP
jgi:hypothetical protein